MGAYRSVRDRPVNEQYVRNDVLVAKHPHHGTLCFLSVLLPPLGLLLSGLLLIRNDVGDAYTGKGCLVSSIGSAVVGLFLSILVVFLK